MGVTKTILKEGNGKRPTNGKTVTIEYTGWLKDKSKPNNKGAHYVTATSLFDSSIGRSDFVFRIGFGEVIKGLDEGIIQMKVGEKATLDITPDYGYGALGDPGRVPPNSALIFNVVLKKVA